MNITKVNSLILATTALLLAIALISFPQESFEASQRGLQIWWGVVFPSLLPFFIISELLIGFGVVRFIGFLLEPLMRPLFKVPGVGGFVWAMGMASGYPAGAKFTARLRQENQLTAIEAERLVSFTNSSNPLFIFGAVAIGFFQNASLGIILAISHYLGNICVGLIMRFHGKENVISKSSNKRSKKIIHEALRSAHESRLQDNRPLGKLLGDAITSSVHTLLMIGGFIILFSVLNKLLSIVHITAVVAYLLEYMLAVFDLPEELGIPLFSGLFEITLGSQLTSETPNISLIYQAVITSFILAFSGLSVQAQVASILAETDIRFRPFFVARIFHGFFAALFAYILWKPLYINALVKSEHGSNVIPSFSLNTNFSIFYDLLHIMWSYGPIITLTTLCCYVFLYIKKLRLFS
ncbi:sporulation integral membrane protein YlbJ [Cytobacillus sp. Hm23]